MRERLQKIIAHAGIASRRKAEELIREGRVTVNGKVVRELGTCADPQRDHIRVDRKLIQPEPFEYYLLNKPRGVLSAATDPKNRPLGTDFVKTGRRLYPAGRLDYNSEGLIILTNDGDLTRLITQAGTLKKFYRVKVKGCPTPVLLRNLEEGVVVEGERMSASAVRLLKRGNNAWLEVVLEEGKNRQVRRMFESIGHPVMRLKRTRIGMLSIGELKPGEARRLTKAEVEALRKQAFDQKRKASKRVGAKQ